MIRARVNPPVYPMRKREPAMKENPLMNHPTFWARNGRRRRGRREAFRIACSSAAGLRGFHAKPIPPSVRFFRDGLAIRDESEVRAAARFWGMAGDGEGSSRLARTAGFGRSAGRDMVRDGAGAVGSVSPRHGGAPKGLPGRAAASSRHAVSRHWWRLCSMGEGRVAETWRNQRVSILPARWAWSASDIAPDAFRRLSSRRSRIWRSVRRAARFSPMYLAQKMIRTIPSNVFMAASFCHRSG